jgi:hypothetical protein
MIWDWLDWSNPVAIWWSFLVTISALNVILLIVLRASYLGETLGPRRVPAAIEPLLLLSAAYVLGCAFRSILPRADVQRIVLFDTWLSSVMVGRSVATPDQGNGDQEKDDRQVFAACPRRDGRRHRLLRHLYVGHRCANVFCALAG